MKKGRFLWSAHRITEKPKAGKARNIKEKQLKNSRSTASKPPVARLSSPSAKKVLFSPENFGFPGFSLPIVRILKSVGSDFRGNRPQYVVVWQKLTTIFEVGKVV
jgi:hypothetical protein